MQGKRDIVYALFSLSLVSTSWFTSWWYLRLVCTTYGSLWRERYKLFGQAWIFCSS